MSNSCESMDYNPPGFSVHGILQARTLVVVVLCYSLSRVQLFATPWTGILQAPLSMGVSRQEYWNGLPFPSPGFIIKEMQNKNTITFHISQCQIFKTWVNPSESEEKDKFSFAPGRNKMNLVVFLNLKCLYPFVSAIQILKTCPLVCKNNIKIYYTYTVCNK